MTYQKEYEMFFTSPAGLHVLEWLKSQREAFRIKAEKDPANPAHATAAGAYGELLMHIEAKLPIGGA